MSGTLERVLLFTLLLLILYIVVPCEANLRALLAEIKRNCTRHVRPVRNQTHAVNVTSRLRVYQLNHLNLVEQNMNIKAWLKVEWQNELVSWDPDDFDGIDRLDLEREDDLWIPDLVFNNQITDDNALRKLKVPYTILNTGLTEVSEPLTATFLCTMDAHKFPFDSHACELELMSWTYSDRKLHLQAEDAGDAMQPNPLWKLKPMQFHYVVEKNEEPIGDSNIIVYTIHIERRSDFFVVNVIVPSILINYMSLVSFLIPCHSEEKISFSITTFLAQTVNLMSISQFTPNGGFSIPILGQYLLGSILYIVLTVLINVFVTSLLKAKKPERTVASKHWKFILNRVNPLTGPFFERPESRSSTRRETHVQKKLEKDIAQENTESNFAELVLLNGGNTVAGNSPLSAEDKLEVICETVNRVALIISCCVLTALTSVSMTELLT